MKEHVLFQENLNSDRLVVYFSSASSTKSFEGFSLMAKYPDNKLFIKDPYRSWYQGSEQGVFKSADELLVYLRNIVSKFEKNKIIFIGASMGAYGALLFGIQLDVGKIIAFSPQIILNSKLPFSPKNKAKYADISTLIQQNKHCNIDIWFGEEEPVDIYQIYHILTAQKVNLLPVKGSAHNILYQFKEKVVLVDLFDFYFEGKPLHFSLHDSSFLSNNLELFEIMYKAIDYFYIQENPKRALYWLEQNDRRLNGWAVAYYLKGLIYVNQKQDDMAILQFKNAVFIQFLYYDCVFELGTAYLRIRNDDLAEKCLQLAIKIYPKPSATHYAKLANAQWNQNKNNEAKENALIALKLDEQSSLGNYILARIYSSEKLHDMAIKHFKILLNIKPMWPHVQFLLNLEYQSMINDKIFAHTQAKNKYNL